MSSSAPNDGEGGLMTAQSPGLLERQVLRARNGFAYLTGANHPALGQTPRDLIWKRDKARLWRYRSANRRYRPPILHSLVSKFLLDWVPPDPADAENTLETYVDEHIRRRSGLCSPSRTPMS
jgi:polyhydroxyalkanoate synthase subunit PhaC